ncbi:MAG: hypothetical protein JWM93_3970 [Frankiales bacterium]|nr:hypothetical protein [Frankiales bacterium]
MTVLDVAGAHYREQNALATRVMRQARRFWDQLDPKDLTASWARDRIGDQLLVLVSSAQYLAATTADAYLDALLLEQAVEPAAEGMLQPRAFAGVASDGRELEPLLYSPVTTAKSAIAEGSTVRQALAAGGFALERIVSTQVADLGRAAVSAAAVARPRTTGWVRMLTFPSCDRCAVLAGKWYRWNRGFQRHERCNCIHVPAAEAADVDDVRTDPKAYFDSLTPEQQDHYFTEAGARAIRDGADVGQVVNARRGARGLTTPGRLTSDEQQVLRGGRERGHLERTDVYGRQLYITSEGVTVQGLAGQRLGAREGARQPGDRYRSARTPRLMPESVYELAGDDRGEAIRLLQRFGYIT